MVVIECHTEHTRNEHDLRVHAHTVHESSVQFRHWKWDTENSRNQYDVVIHQSSVWFRDRKLNTVNMRNKHGITVHDQKTKIPCNSVIGNETRKTHGINTMSPCTRCTRKFRVVPWYKIKHGKHTEQTRYCRARSVHEISVQFRHIKLNTENTRNQHGVGVRNS